MRNHLKMYGGWCIVDSVNDRVLFTEEESPYIMYLTFPDKGVKENELTEYNCLFVEICFN
tara:strand:- start:851 stop:1030 length:180 start_codon:yes stop_codon:yes gene_type:complete